jgi:predicted MFS family arabinose efflux permease
MIPQTAGGLAWRNRAFGRYNAVAYLAGSFGALVAGGPDFFRRIFPALPASQRFLLVYPVVGVIGGLLVMRLSPRVERLGTSPPDGRRVLVRSRRTVERLAALFAVDAFAGGFVVNAFIVFWFERKYGASTETMGLVFFVSGLLQAGSSIAAGRLANRIGQLNTMVFTHVPSNILLMLVPLMPSFELAVLMLLARSAISQMDVPARQAYVVSVVDPQERVAAASYTNTTRYVVRPAGAALGGWLTGLWAAGPFVVAGSLKIVYDAMIWATFRRVREREDDGT